MDYDQHIYYNGKIVGQAQIVKEGLYYQIQCCCQLDRSCIYRIKAKTTHRDIYVGVCTPVGSCFLTDGKIPVKALEGESVQFCVEPCNEKQGLSEQICSDKPFEKLEMLCDARLKISDGRFYVISKDA